MTLRPVEERDYPLIHAWQNDPDVWWRMDYERPFSLQDIADDAESSRKEGFPFVIEAEGRPIGRIGLNQFRARDRICSLYLFVGDRKAWGKGYAKESVATLLAYAFERWDLHQVELWSLAANEPAIRVYEACGFVPDARLRARSFKDGAWVDRIVMSVRREEFERARALGASTRGGRPSWGEGRRRAEGHRGMMPSCHSFWRRFYQALWPLACGFAGLTARREPV